MIYRSFILSFLFASPSFAALQALDDEEMSNVSGQALLTVDRYDYSGNNFYQLKLNGTIENNINIGKLLLRGSDGNAQIDIDNLSLSGDPDGISDGNLSSATLTNPFLELAFKGPSSADNAQNREIIGMRIGADNMDGYMSFGSQTDESGINSFRGYMATDPLTGHIRTLDSAGRVDASGNVTVPSYVTVNNPADLRTNGLAGRTATPGFQVTAYACITVAAGINCSAGSTGRNPNGADINTDVLIPNGSMSFGSVSLGSSASPITLKQGGVVINTNDGNAISSTSITTDILKLPSVPFRLRGTGTATVNLPWYPPFFGISFDMDTTVDAIGYLGNESNGMQLEARSTLDQELRYIHRAQVTGNGFYLSAQNEALKWRNSPGSFADADQTNNDVAQPGWWMSIKDPVALGTVFVDGVYLPDESIRQIADRTNTVLYDTQRVPVPLSQAFGAVIETDIGVINFDNSSITPIQIDLDSQSLGPNQAHIVNCWNGNISC